MPAYDGSHSELDDGFRHKTTPHISSLHVGECSMCLAHVAHLEKSTLASSHPPAKSKAPLNGQRTFLDGIRVGKLLQLAEDRIIMEEYRRQVRSLKEKILKGRSQMIADIVSRFAVFQTELDDLCAMEDLGQGGVDESEVGCEEEDEINKHDDQGDAKDGKSGVPCDGESDDEGDWSSSEETDEEEFSCDEQGEESNSLGEAGMDDDQSDTSESETDSPLPATHSREIVLRCGYIGVVSDEDNSDEEDTIGNLAELIEGAREPGNIHHLAAVKLRIKHAQQILGDRRTLAQQYLLHHWRRPDTSLLLHRPTPELFVDASQVGIGVYLGTRWLAWTFVPNHPYIEYGPDGKIDTSWAELIAVEVGIYVVLAEGYRDTPISIWSDNKGVVEALKRESWTTKHNLDGILGNILQTLDMFDLVESAKWVPSKENPADKPSRGMYPPKKLMLNYPLRFPSCFTKFLARVDLD